LEQDGVNGLVEGLAGDVEEDKEGVIEGIPRLEKKKFTSCYQHGSVGVFGIVTD
jgi:hypothetical protein